MAHTLKKVPIIQQGLTKVSCANCGLIVVGTNTSTMANATAEHKCEKIENRRKAIWTL